jgi:GT2 family glycosyltransferase
MWRRWLIHHPSPPDGRMMQLSLPASVDDNPLTTGGQIEWAPDPRIAAIDVSVCIANWNCKEHLHACLESLREDNQGVRVETIVVDNASSDGAADMVESEFPHVILVRNQDNLGFAKASNQAAAQASGRYVFFLNNDTIIPRDTLRKLIDFAEVYPQLGMLGPRLKDGFGRLQISYRRKPTVAAMLHRTAIMRWTGLFKYAYDDYRRKNFEPKTVRRVDVLMGAALLMRREVFERCGRWDEDFRFGVEDVELSIRVGKDYPLIYLPGVEIIHHGRISSRMNVTFSAPNLLIGYVRYFRKTGSSRLSILAYKLIVTLDSPLQLIGKALQCGMRWLRGKKTDAQKSFGALRGVWHFVTRDLWRFWRA